jgi:NADPH:quinone reductase-like Zn-dependent oxidoreductase
MKAFLYTKYGHPEKVLQLKEVEKPVPKENEVLIKIHATAINDYDWSMVKGEPGLYRLLFGVFKPKHLIPGMELAGTVEALGPETSFFEVGDAVYGDTSDYGFGTFAKYMCINEKALIKKPDNVSFEEAASISHASMLAVQGLHDIGKLQNGQKILINGAGGGVGTFGLQIAKMQEAEVTGVDSGDKLEMMKQLGFDHIIDYKKEDFTRNGQTYDLILDCKTSRSPSAHAKSLKPGGIYVTVGGTIPRLLQLAISRLFGRTNMHILALKANRDLAYINELFEEGKIKTAIDGPYPFDEIPRLVQYFGEGKHQGKVIVKCIY